MWLKILWFSRNTKPAISGSFLRILSKKIGSVYYTWDVCGSFPRSIQPEVFLCGVSVSGAELDEGFWQEQTHLSWARDGGTHLSKGWEDWGNWGTWHHNLVSRVLEQKGSGKEKVWAALIWGKDIRNSAGFSGKMRRDLWETAILNHAELAEFVLKIKKNKLIWDKK